MLESPVGSTEHIALVPEKLPLGHGFCEIYAFTRQIRSENLIFVSAITLDKAFFFFCNFE
jgi:hypothetical protein